MKRSRRVALCITQLTTSLVASVLPFVEVKADPIKDCDREAATAFLIDHGEPHRSKLEGKVNASRNFMGIYSLRRQTCLYLLSIDLADARAGWPTGHSLSSTRLTLTDLKSKQVIGQYFKMAEHNQPEICIVNDNKCRSEAEWLRMLLAEL